MCAWCVLFAHSYVLSGMQEKIVDPFDHYFGIGMGSFFVVIFFAISGFLIQRSVQRSSSLRSYFQARALRLFPALTMVLLITVFILGPWFSTLSWQAYFTDERTWQYLYNLNLLDVNTQFSLPGVFENNTYPIAVNGSIWTLPFETWMYVMTALLFFTQSKILSKKPQYQAALTWITLSFVCSVIVFVGNQLQASEQRYYDILMFISTFFIGAVFYNFRAKIPLNGWLMLILLACIPWFKGSLLTPLYIPLTIVYSVLVLAYLPAGSIRKYNKFGDYSYGLYIYAFPVQQSLAYYFDLSFAEMVLWTTLITLPIAILSWHLIESPALKLKRRRNTPLKLNG